MASQTFSDSVGQFRSVATELLSEWRAELARFGAEMLSGPLARGGERVVLEVAGEQVRIKLAAGNTARELGIATGLGQVASGEISSVLAASEFVPRGTTDIVVELPENEVLRRRFELPAARKSTLARAVPFELERLSPIEADRLYYDFIVLDAGRAKKNARLELRIVKRSTVDAAFAIARAAGLRVGAVRFAGETREADWRSFPLDRVAWLRLKWRQWNVVGLGLLAIVLAIGIVFAAYMRGTAAADALSAQLDVASTRAEVVHHIGREISDVRAQIEFPLAQKQGPLLLSILAEVTHVLPDGNWLTEFELNGGKVHIQGFSKSASDVVADIDRSPMFANAQFMAPLQSAQNGNERFDLSFDVNGSRH
ncbi:MAG: PilN domain-containing protein [Rhizomicrobium sp.]